MFEGRSRPAILYQPYGKVVNSKNKYRTCRLKLGRNNFAQLATAMQAGGSTPQGRVTEQQVYRTAKSYAGTGSAPEATTFSRWGPAKR